MYLPWIWVGIPPARSVYLSLLFLFLFLVPTGTHKMILQSTVACRMSEVLPVIWMNRKPSYCKSLTLDLQELHPDHNLSSLNPLTSVVKCSRAVKALGPLQVHRSTVSSVVPCGGSYIRNLYKCLNCVGITWVNYWFYLESTLWFGLLQPCLCTNCMCVHVN